MECQSAALIVQADFATAWDKCQWMKELLLQVTWEVACLSKIQKYAVYNYILYRPQRNFTSQSYVFSKMLTFPSTIKFFGTKKKTFTAELEGRMYLESLISYQDVPGDTWLILTFECPLFSIVMQKFVPCICLSTVCFQLYRILFCILWFCNVIVDFLYCIL